MDFGQKIAIVELTKDKCSGGGLNYTYQSSKHYDLTIEQQADSWQIGLTLKTLTEPVTKKSKEPLYPEYIEEPSVYAATIDGEKVGLIQLGYHSWNKRMRLWNILIDEPHRRKGIGTFLMRHAEQVARERGARMLVLETQSCNVPAIQFYNKYGFQLIGFDSAAYTNDDITRKELRLEFGLPLTV